MSSEDDPSPTGGAPGAGNQENDDSTSKNNLPSNSCSNHETSNYATDDDDTASPSNTANGVTLNPKAFNSHVASQSLYNWQSTKSNIKDRISFLFNKEILSDVHFLVGKGSQQQRIPAHKFVLSVGSAVFDALFNGAMATQNSEIELPDVEPAAFLALLCFLYSDEVFIGPESVMMTLYTAKKYAVPALEKACVDFLKCNLSSDNAFMMLTQARLFDEPQLAALCFETIDKNTSEALTADGFVDIDLDTLCAVLDRDTLRIREARLFQAVLRYVQVRSMK